MIHESEGDYGSGDDVQFREEFSYGRAVPGLSSGWVSDSPFKSQNMALNSYITRDGLEMGRAQVMQAEAAGVEPSADMNPILLKPTSVTGSQVIVHGKVRGQMGAADYFKYKKR